MKKMSAYNAYLQGKQWKDFRERTVKERGKCEKCGKVEDLMVHHLTYERLGNELPEDILVLCEHCHREIHAKACSGKARFNTYGFRNYFRNIVKLTSELSESAIFVLTILSQYIDWDTGRLLYKRKKKPVLYQDLLIILGYSNGKVSNIVRELNSQNILLNDNDGKGYYINQSMYKGKNRFQAKVGD